ncbi:MAG: CARDB domain-containing protein, partial [Candidatus Amoebophilus sp.]
MENNPKKSKALIITIILIIVILLAGYLVIKNRDAFGVKTSATIAKIFSPLIPSENSANLTTVDVQAGEDIAKGDSVSVFGTGTNNNPIVVKTSTNNGTVYGYANQDIKSGYAGKVVVPSNTGSSGFWNSISSFINTIITPTPPATISNVYQCAKDGVVVDCSVVPVPPTPGYVCTKDGVVVDCSVVPVPPTPGYVCAKDGVVVDCSVVPVPPTPGYVCTKDGVVVDCSVVPSVFPSITVTANPTSIAKGGSSTISWDSTNTKTCDAGSADRGTNTTGMFLTGVLAKSTSYTISCMGVNELTSSDTVFIEVAGSKIPDLVASRVTPNTAVVKTPTVLSFTIKNIGNSEAKGNFPNYFRIKNTDTNKSLPIISIVSPSIAAKSEGRLEKNYTFNEIGNYSITFCADQNDPINN